MWAFSNSTIFLGSSANWFEMLNRASDGNFNKIRIHLMLAIDTVATFTSTYCPWFDQGQRKSKHGFETRHLKWSRDILPNFFWEINKLTIPIETDFISDTLLHHAQHQILSMTFTVYVFNLAHQNCILKTHRRKSNQQRALALACDRCIVVRL